MKVTRRTALKIGLGSTATPLLASLPLSAEEPEPAAAAEDHVVARPIPLNRVRLTGGPLAHARDLDGNYLLQLEPDRMLAYYREHAGLPKKAEPYGGWDGGGRNLTGHIAGHYLSAVSLMCAATGDARFKERADYIVSEFKVVQDKHGDGYLVALENGRRAFGELQRGVIRSAAFDLNGEWSPWYTLHKTFAGLRDAYRHTGNRTALDVEARFAGWAEGILAPLDAAQVQRMLNTEHGGMNEVLVELYADTGDRRWLDLSFKFEHREFIDPLVRHQDNLAGKHGNTQIPKLIGSAERYVQTGRATDLIASSFFFDRVAQHHSFSSGGHGTDEYFGPPDHIGERIDGRTAESCNVYNMIKLSRTLFSVRPDPEVADFHERALLNHILGSIDPDDGRVCYMVPVGQGVQHEYQSPFRSFTCCVGTGMESHALHGYGLYYESGDRLWVNLYASSTAEWSDAGVKWAMETDLPDGDNAKLTFTIASPREFTLSLRHPYWAGDGFAVRVNGESVAIPALEPASEARRGSRLYDWPFKASTYVDVKRTWRTGDTVELALPKTLRIEPTPDNPRRISLMWGPLVLAGDLGPEPARRAQNEDEDEDLTANVKVPVFVAADRPVTEWLRPVAGQPGRFRTVGVGREPDAASAAHEVDFVPFYHLPRRTYSLYWDLFTPDEWEKERATYAAAAEKKRRLEAATVAWLQPGETVFEREFNYQGAEDSSPQRMMGTPGRRGATWFSYDVPVEPAHPMVLILTFYSDDRRGSPGTFDILVDGRIIGEQSVGRSEPRRFYDVEHPIPAELVRGKAKITVRFQAKPNSQIPTIFGVRMIRGDAAR
jgi:uncharacterized protein